MASIAKANSLFEIDMELDALLEEIELQIESEGDCVKKTRKRHAVRKMKVGPSEPPCRGRLQTTLSCFGPKGRGGER